MKLLLLEKILIFQFHKGAIRTFPPFAQIGSHVNFNSIKVRLELLRVLLVPFLRCYFNSIKVRLELYRITPQLDYADVFQFHKGAIRTPRGIALDNLSTVISIP